MTLNHGMLGTTKYNSQLGVGTLPIPDPFTPNLDIGVTRSTYYLERIIRGII